MSSQKSIFSIFASIGPGGALIALVEKLYRSTWFPDGYALGNEEEYKYGKESMITKFRQDYVNQLFDIKAKVDKGTKTLDEVYLDLEQLIEEEYFPKIRDLEQGKLESMRKFYHHEGNVLKVRKVKESHDKLNLEVRESLYKMAAYIVRGIDQSRLIQLAQKCAEDAGEEGRAANLSKLSARSFQHEDEEVTISEATARLLLHKWKVAKLRKDQEEAATPRTPRTDLLSPHTFMQRMETQHLEAEVFFSDSGHSVDEILRAFEEYGLKMEITAKDHERFINGELDTAELE